MKLLAPAKINLFLRVLKKRKDGYHELHTLFQRVSLCDEVILKPLPKGIRVRCSLKSLPTGPSNIAYQAAKLLKERCAAKKGVSVFIRKRIPVQAGLGGGSSDAAAVLLGLNRLWKLGLSKHELCRLGARVGSDVPFFILDVPFAEARGRGERLRPLRMKRAKFWHVIVKPPFGISTKKAYQAIDTLAGVNKKVGVAPSPISPANAGRLPCNRGKQGMGLTLQKTNVRMLLRSLKKGDSGRLSQLLVNSLEVIGNKQLKEIFRLKKQLLEVGALASLMSGSGSSVFGLFRSRKAAVEASRVLRKSRNSKVFVVSTY